MVRLLNSIALGVLALGLPLCSFDLANIHAKDNNLVPAVKIDLLNSETIQLTTGEKIKLEYYPFKYKNLDLELVPEWYRNSNGEGFEISSEGIACATRPGKYEVFFDFHFSDSSKKKLDETYPNDPPEFPATVWSVAFDVSDNPYVFRMYNPNSGEHFYTTQLTERSALKQAGWQAEGFNWFGENEGGRPIYRLYDPNAGDHLFTADRNEYDELAKHGWRQEGVAWQSSKDCWMPVYRLYNPNAKTGRHHMTNSRKEADYLVSLGWKDEGICWYGLDPQGPDIPAAE